MKSLVLALLSILVCTTVAHADDAGRPPSWLLTVDGGLLMKPGVEDGYGLAAPDLGGALGLTLAVQSLDGNTVKFAELQGMPLGGVYMGRAGIVWGARVKRPYYLWIGSSSSTVGNVRTVTNTYEVRPGSPIAWVIGLDLALGVIATTGDTGGTRLVGEVGFGMIGQHRIDFLGLLDSSGTLGLRITTLMFGGDKTRHTFGWRLGLHVFFDFKEHPAPLLFTFGIGPGGSFEIPGTPAR
ncbi:MAG: hypothetical protein KF773_08310 [Deltaproteobacteria bacterium]|nr:hypothetical protein [Deltaproteobacteria bacterium]MCW5805976.1 hypothetical protein [Deltaproteobacteria bacterium]